MINFKKTSFFLFVLLSVTCSGYVRADASNKVLVNSVCTQKKTVKVEVKTSANRLCYLVCTVKDPGKGESIKEPIKLENLPEVYTKEMAVKNGDYVNIHGMEIHNQSALDDFIQKVSKKQDAFLRRLIFTIEGDPIITDFLYKNGMFTVTTDMSRDKFGGGADSITSKSYKNLVTYKDEEGKTYYYITNLTNITKEDLNAGIDAELINY